jgi:hypothetical protein
MHRHYPALQRVIRTLSHLPLSSIEMQALAELEELSAELLASTPYSRSLFTIENGPINIWGYYNPNQNWNGWEMPLFEMHNIVGFLTSIDNEWKYNHATDSIVTYYRDAPEEVDEWPGKDILVDGKTIHVYPVGAGLWVWEKAPLES